MVCVGRSRVIELEKPAALRASIPARGKKKKEWQSYNLILKDTLGILSLWDPGLVLGRRRDSQNLF